MDAKEPTHLIIKSSMLFSILEGEPGASFGLQGCQQEHFITIKISAVPLNKGPDTIIQQLPIGKVLGLAASLVSEAAIKYQETDASSSLTLE